MKKELFRENYPNEIFMHSFLCQREKKRHWVVCRTRPCVLRFRAEDHFILGGKRPRVSKHHNDCVRGEICFKEIVSNTRLDLNCSSFHAFGLWVFNYLQIYFYTYIQYLFIAFAYQFYLCYCLLLNMCFVPFTLSQK